MTARPILRPIPCLRAKSRMTDSLTGNTSPANSLAFRYLGHSAMWITTPGYALALPSVGLQLHTALASEWKERGHASTRSLA